MLSVRLRVRRKQLTATACCLVGVLAAGLGAAEGRSQEPDDPAGGQAEPLTGPRDLLGQVGIDQEQFDRLEDGVPWAEHENELLLRILFRLGRFRMTEIETWARNDLQPARLAEDPDAARGEIFRVGGRVTSVDVVGLPPEKAQRFELSEYYRCELRLDAGQHSAVVFARTIPEAWKAGGPIDEPAGCFGLFLKVGSDGAGRPQPIFVARRVAWYRPTPLGKLGMDAGLFDDVRPGTRLTRGDRECFYQMLAAAGRAGPGQLIQEARRQLGRSGEDRFSVEPLFNDAGRQQGRLVVLSGTAREVLRVEVGDEDVLARFGIDHYYQIALFTDDSQGNPLIFCVRELPEGMPTGADPQYGERVTVVGFFFSTWAYRNRQAAEGPGNRAGGQLAPLLIGREAVWHSEQEGGTSGVIGVVAAGLFFAVLLGVWLVLWRYGRGDKRFRDETLAGYRSMPPGVSLEELEVDSEEVDSDKDAQSE